MKKVGPPIHNEIAIVNIPVKVLFKFSDNIVVDVDDHDEPVEFTSGYIMHVLPNQKFVFNNHERQTVCFTFDEK